jgi:hypothetical protein
VNRALLLLLIAAHAGTAGAQAPAPTPPPVPLTDSAPDAASRPQAPAAPSAPTTDATQATPPTADATPAPTTAPAAATPEAPPPTDAAPEPAPPQAPAAAPSPEPPQQPGPPPSLLGPLDPEHGPSHDWSRGRTRWFLSGMFDMGFLYLRPRFSAGYGQPHHRWFGVEANPLFAALFQGEGVGGYAGVRGALPALDLRAGARFFYTFERSFLCPTLGYREPDVCAGMAVDDFYSREDIESRVGPRSVYVTWETELTLDVPAGPGKILTELALSAITGVDEDFFVFEEQIKVVARPPWVWRARLGYAFPLDVEKAIKLGVVAELVSIEGRELYVVRGGLTGSVRLFHDLEARGLFIPVIAARDTLGAAGGDTFLLSLRYRWSTN